jgi:hypothetical protein
LEYCQISVVAATAPMTKTIAPAANKKPKNLIKSRIPASARDSASRPESFFNT